MEPESKNTFDFASWLVGFIDGEGCFCLSFSERERLTLKIEVRPSFSVSQNSKSMKILETMNTYFGCGGVRHSKRENTHKYEVRNLNHLTTVIIPFFRKYPLLTNKQKDFLLFDQACMIIKENRHLSKEGLKEILQLAAQMNTSGTRKNSIVNLLNILDLDS
uniref:Putative site-specific DNA endonuclease n=1 Tax=Monomastix sp. (strain OKE-1) TaxID=141716 RepID=C0JWR4_MONSK|nr:putative site-specific DNA endonuclease [Monomastix sp. OKE-1]ACK36928.1 putative site-specific DNA endonuclease [Monomastix sp. OKE-1]